MQPETTRRWWWPYTHRTVIGFWCVLFLIKIAVGASAAVGNASQGTQDGWIWLLNSWNLTYDYTWSELTEGEGSLFWIISVNGYSDNDPKNIAKFPLYPAATRAVWELSGRTLSVPFLLSMIHSLMVWAGLAEIFRFWENYHEGYGKRAIMWLCFSPLFIFQVWLTSYMEPGFIALVWLIMTLEYQERWAASSAALFCLTMLQPSGVILACFLGIRRLSLWWGGKTSFGAVVWALGPGIAWSLWMILTSLWFDKFLAPYAFQAEWGRTIYRWPWDRWMRYTLVAIQEGYRFGHFVKNISMTWIALGYVWGTRLWLKLSPEQRSRFGGAWAFPLFTIIIVLLPFSTSTAGVERYALTTLIGVWPLLFAHSIQDTRSFKRFERHTWIFSVIMCFVILFAFVTGYRHMWLLYF